MIKTLFDNLNEFSAGDFATVYKNIFDSGILCPFGETILNTTALKVTNSSGNALIGNGSALIKGRVITVSDETVTLSTNGTYKIILEWSAASDSSQLKAITGTLVQTETLYQILLATVTKSGTSLTVTDGRSFINRMTDDQAINLQTAQQTGWSKVEEAISVDGVDPMAHTYYWSAPSSIASVLQFGTKVKFTQDSTVKYATIKSITVSGNTATIYFDSDVEITGSVITDIYCNNSGAPIGFPSGLSKDYLLKYESNANGEYYKYADGKLECYGKNSKTMDCNKPWGSYFFDSVAVMDFLPYPMAFTSISHVGYTNTGTAAFLLPSNYPTGQTGLTSPRSLLFERPVSLAAGAFSATYMAVGRWK